MPDVKAALCSHHHHYYHGLLLVYIHASFGKQYGSSPRAQWKENIGYICWEMPEGCLLTKSGCKNRRHLVNYLWVEGEFATGAEWVSLRASMSYLYLLLLLLPCLLRVPGRRSRLFSDQWRCGKRKLALHNEDDATLIRRTVTSSSSRTSTTVKPKRQQRP